jgi:hypothetical protein
MPVRHMAAMTLGADGTFGTGATTARCGLKIPAREDGPFIPHSNLRFHTTCPDCIAVDDFRVSGPPDLSSPIEVEQWLLA